ncbi:MAG: creatininase family protein [Candidatus Dormibacteria bacterium]
MITLLLEEVGWPDVEEYLKTDDRIIIVTGSCEQHGRHLPFPTDWVQPYEMARRVSESTGIAVSPPLTFGMSLHHMSFPGTLSLTPETFALAVHDIVWSAHQHGFRRVLVLNGHGGNTATLGALASRLALELPALQLRLVDWWHLPAVDALIVELFGEPEAHAGSAETSNMMRLRPGSVRIERATATPSRRQTVYSREDWKRFYPDGNCGPDPRLASPAAGDRILALAASELERMVGDWE